jgi:metal-responsive CopG/Arc/MetJ family transcriptional regulator
MAQLNLELKDGRMKKKISISMDEDALAELEKVLANTGGSFRNKSHLIEFAVTKLLKEKEEGK